MQLVRGPKELFDIPTLTELYCSDCGADRPPKNVQEEGVDAMRRWWAAFPSPEAAAYAEAECFQAAVAAAQRLRDTEVRAVEPVRLDADFADSVPDDDAFIGDMGIKALKGFIEKAGLSHADW